MSRIIVKKKLKEAVRQDPDYHKSIGETAFVNGQLMKKESDRRLSFFQRFFTAIFPQSWAESMEADSRRWFMKCLECGFEQSYWEMGGIRWKATGNQRNYQKCSKCGRRSWHQSYKKEAEQAEEK